MSIALEVVIMGDTVRIDANITNYDGTAYDPDSQSIQLYQPNGTASGAALITPTKTAIGRYTQEVTIPSAAGTPAGRWYVRWACTSGTKISTGNIYFDVKP